MHKYNGYLESHNEHMKQVQNLQSPIMSPGKIFSVSLIAASFEPIKRCCSNVQEALVNLEAYELIFHFSQSPITTPSSLIVPALELYLLKGEVNNGKKYYPNYLSLCYKSNEKGFPG